MEATKRKHPYGRPDGCKCHYSGKNIRRFSDPTCPVHKSKDSGTR